MHDGASSEHAGASSSAVAGAHNEADVEFNQMMIPHHRQAVVMADLVPTRTTNAELQALAAQIKSAQQPEIDAMSARLSGWGVEVPAEDSMTMGHGGHGGMPGMMTEEQMTAMENASGAEFDRLWLEGMIAHHEGAVAMANEEIASGSDPSSKEMAEQIKASQTAEIAQMKHMLGS